ncbi:MAG: 7TM diverse intracellular signaling domain-containing protein [Cytophagales bacterium]
MNIKNRYLKIILKAITIVVLMIFNHSISCAKNIDTVIIASENKNYSDYLLHKNEIGFVQNNTNSTLQNIINSNFEPINQLNQKYTGNYWVKISVKNINPQNNNWVLLQGDPHVGNLKIYELSPDGKLVLKTQGGFEIPFELRKYYTNSIATSIHLPYNKCKTFYLNYNSTNPFSFKIAFQSEQFFSKYTISEYFILGIYYGIILVMALYNLSIFMSVRDKVYLYYVLYAVSTLVFNTSNDTMGFQFIWPNNPIINNSIYVISNLLFVVSIYLYSSSFLNLNRSYKKQNLYIVIAIIFYVIFVLLDQFIFHTNWFLFVVIIPFSIIFGTAIYVYKNGYSPARYFIAGFSGLFIGLITFILMEKSVINSNVITVYAFNLGLLIEVFFFSRAIGDRFRFLKIEKEKTDQLIIEKLKENETLKDKLNKELENAVQQRTSELNLAKNELEKAYHEIKRINELLQEDNETLKEDNHQLQYDVQELAKARVMLKGINFEEFCQIYPTDESCLEFLADLKWKNGYKCSKCENQKFSEGKAPFSRRCSKCNYEESALLNTIFSRVKFPLTKAFYMLFLYISSKEKLTSTNLSNILKLRQKTCWSFLQKIKEHLDSYKTDGKKLEKWTECILDPEKK